MNDIERWLRDSSKVKIELAETQSDLIHETGARIARALAEGRKLYLFGNGGSAGDAQHIAAELINRFLLDRGPLPAIALTTNASVVTSVANDYGFTEIFSKQIAALVREGDIAWGLSTSGNSPNVVAALRLAREMGAVTVGLTGKTGGAMKEYCDYCICVPSEMTPFIQESHIAVGHAVCDLIERTIFEGSHEI
ncbi:MAG: D-sedoheptulose 7-phosphate isomerase [Planctomycetes bacterium]|nr:D-sedoheptulose 7-phosphate isomerase [Planctomycetota bacterium]